MKRENVSCLDFLKQNPYTDKSTTNSSLRIITRQPTLSKLLKRDTSYKSARAVRVNSDLKEIDISTIKT